MEKKSTQKLLCYLSGGFFLIHAGYLLINNVMTWMDYFTLTGFVTGVLAILLRGLVGIGMVTEKREFALYGVGAGILGMIITLVVTVVNLTGMIGYLNWSLIANITLSSIWPLVSWGILAYIAYSGCKQKILPVLSGVFFAVYQLRPMFLGISINWTAWEDWIGLGHLVMIPMAGFALIGMEQKIPAPVIRTAQKVTPAATGPDKFERLKQLKNLLDMGAITQEEFEQKKKEIINS